jgi:SNF2 family DNA or RNA helicase
MYNWKITPFPHQIEGFDALVNNQRLLLSWDMGLGKTAAIIAATDYLMQQGEIKNILVITKASLVYTFADEVRRFSDRTCLVINGSFNHRRNLYTFEMHHYDYVVVGYETFREDWVVYTDFDCLVLDEAHKIKNPESIIGEVIHEIPAKRVYLLTGTPIINSPLESYNLLKRLGVIDYDYNKFLHHFAVMQNKKILRYKNMAELRQIIQGVQLRKTKDEVLDLPPKIQTIIPIPMLPKQRKLYETIKHNLKKELKDFDLTVTNINRHPLTKLLRLKQVTTDPRLLGADAPSAKIKVLEEQIEDLDKAVVFTQFREEVCLLAKDFAAYNPVVITGDTDKKERNELVKRFQEDPSCRLFIGTLGACREGLTLTAASHCFFLDEEWAEAYNIQAEDRLYRIGQKQTVNIYRYRCVNTIDEYVGQILLRKQNMFNRMINNDVKDYAELIRKVTA